ncbi:dihydrodipicolinate synthase family protein [Halogeometricum limi]|uniref:4-hydroxy-tetrahydrodipicolinate synthase n=1 Tax=Halogeometricum limi TaxID=555875 RepID=A0A1I6H7A7_9EURY|nr:dihydrodipicolinate synthase family protein [Halogeometricum limi]SFR50174.1 4-hydroxy-tetrahydrodipicolinate synthase [Halogeometricum limi]
MQGIGPPLVTPFTADGAVDESALRDLVGWVEARGVDFLVPCGSNSEAELMTADERARVVEVVADEASVPVLAGTGSPGFEETRRATADAADAGADAALVVTPFYYSHDDATLEAYYRDLADEAEIPIYLYSVPAYTDVKLSPAVVDELATHPNVAGMKDSSGDVTTFVRERRLTRDADFDLLVGAGGVLSHALASGADGGVLALANVAPEAAAEIYEAHVDGDADGARELNETVVELNHAVTAGHGVPGLKAAMRARGAPAGHPRRPFRPVSDDARAELEALVDAL